MMDAGFQDTTGKQLCEQCPWRTVVGDLTPKMDFIRCSKKKRLNAEVRCPKRRKIHIAVKVRLSGTLGERAVPIDRFCC
jgi:hypothetical protein